MTRKGNDGEHSGNYCGGVWQRSCAVNQPASGVIGSTVFAGGQRHPLGGAALRVNLRKQHRKADMPEGMHSESVSHSPAVPG